MSKLIGTNPNQVPLNSHLGSMAYQDASNFLRKDGGYNMQRVDNLLDNDSNLPQHVFIYDTTKDSDGGEWRYSCQDKSWYKEELGTATRGTRRDFPAVVLIVTHTSTVTLYDADDPNLPMWMQFETNGTKIIRGVSNSCAKMLNAYLVVGDEGNYAGTTINFILDGVDNHRNIRGSLVSVANIAQRNDGLNYWGPPTTVVWGNAAGQYVYDLDIAVFDDADIDARTGLPIITIACASNNSILVLHDNSGVAQHGYINGYSAPWFKIAIDAEQKYIWGQRNTQGVYVASIGSVPTNGGSINENNAVNGTGGRRYQNVNDSFSPGLPFYDAQNTSQGYNVNIIPRKAISSQSGLNLLKEDIILEGRPGGLIASINSEHNTGWLTGGTHVATFNQGPRADIDKFEAEGEVANGYFWDNSFVSSGEGGWQNIAVGTGTTTIADRKVTVTRVDQSNRGGVRQYISLKPGRTYTLTFKVISGTLQLKAGAASSPTQYFNNENWNSIGRGVYSTRFEASEAYSGPYQFLIDMIAISNGVTAEMSFVSVSEEKDVSLAESAVAVFGDVPKTPVAPGAELLALGPFASRQHVVIPNEPQIGTGDFSMYFWLCLNSSGTQYVIDYRTADTTNSGLFAYLNVQNTWQIGTTSGSATFNTRAILANGTTWHFVCIKRVSGELQVHINDDPAIGASVTNEAGDIDVMNRVLSIGCDVVNANYPLDGRLALFRVNEDKALSYEQVKYIYNTEKAMFAENSKITFAGRINNVEGMAYDDRTSDIIVGTSHGISRFNNLCLVDSDTSDDKYLSNWIDANNKLRIFR